MLYPLTVLFSSEDEKLREVQAEAESKLRQFENKPKKLTLSSHNLLGDYFCCHSSTQSLPLPAQRGHAGGKGEMMAELRQGPSEILLCTVFFVTVAKAAPYVIQNLTDLEVNISGKIILECKVSGTPEPQITWRKNGYPISAASGECICSSRVVVCCGIVRNTG